jgi:hypothetical protein
MTSERAKAALRVTVAARIRADHEVVAELVAAGFDGVAH